MSCGPLAELDKVRLFVTHWVAVGLGIPIGEILAYNDLISVSDFVTLYNLCLTNFSVTWSSLGDAWMHVPELWPTYSTPCSGAILSHLIPSAGSVCIMFCCVVSHTLISTFVINMQFQRHCSAVWVRVYYSILVHMHWLGPFTLQSAVKIADRLWTTRNISSWLFVSFSPCSICPLVHMYRCCMGAHVLVKFFNACVEWWWKFITNTLLHWKRFLSRLTNIPCC